MSNLSAGGGFLGEADTRKLGVAGAGGVTLTFDKLINYDENDDRKAF